MAGTLEAIERFTENGFTVEIHPDLSPDSPRDWSHGCELVLSMRNMDLPNDAGIDFDEFSGWEAVAGHDGPCPLHRTDYPNDQIEAAS